MLASLVVLLQVLALISLARAQNSTSGTSITSAATTSTSAGSVSSSGTPTSSAAFPSLSGYSDCVVSCLALSVSQTNCTSEVEVNCFCASSRFAPAIVSCVSSTCPAELLTAESLAQKFCVLATTSTSLQFPSPTFNLSSLLTSTMPASTTSASSTTSSSASATKNAGTRHGLRWAVDHVVAVGVLLSILGVVVGTVSVL